MAHTDAVDNYLASGTNLDEVCQRQQFASRGRHTFFDHSRSDGILLLATAPHRPRVVHEQSAFVISIALSLFIIFLVSPLIIFSLFSFLDIFSDFLGPVSFPLCGSVFLPCDHDSEGMRIVPTTVVRTQSLFLPQTALKRIG